VKHRGSLLVLKLLVPYLFILVVPLLIGLVTYHKTLGVIESETIKSNMTLLKQSSDVIDRRLDEVDRIVQQITLDPNVITFQYIDSPFDGINTFRTIDTKNKLINYKLFNHFISSFFVMFKDSDLVLSPNFVYEMPTFYQDVLKRDSLDYSMWYERTVGRYHNKTLEPAALYTIEGKEQMMLTYIQSLGFPANPNGAIVILIDNQEFVKLLSGLDVSDGGWAYIADREGNIISSVTSGSAPPAIDEAVLVSESGTIYPSGQTSNMMTTYISSPYNGWKYVVSQPAHIALKKVNYIKSTMLTIFVLCLAAGVLIALILAHRSSKPVRFLMQTVELLKSNRDALQEEMDKQRPMLQTAFLERLLKGELHQADQIKTVMQHLSIHLDGRSFVVAILTLAEHDRIMPKEVLQDMDVKSLRVKQAVSRLSSRVIVHEMYGNKMALLFSLSCRAAELDSCREQVGQFVAGMRTELEELYISPSIGVGNPYSSLKEISRSYQEAGQALDYNVWKAVSGIVWYADIPQNADSYYYPADIELKLMNYMKSGNQKELKKLLAELYVENFGKRDLTSWMMKLLLSDMKGSIAKLTGQIVMEDSLLKRQVQSLFSASSGTENAQEVYRAIETISLRICHVVDGRKKSHNEQLTETIMAMIHTQYSLPHFSILTISEQLNISEVYVSHFIKEQTGMVFSDYLESIRMGRAIELLEKSSYSVKDIAGKVGYNSSNTFCRAFKRMHGISTTDYKKSFLSKPL
jgi:two-component system response regulator YesN